MNNARPFSYAAGTAHGIDWVHFESEPVVPIEVEDRQWHYMQSSLNYRGASKDTELNGRD